MGRTLALDAAALLLAWFVWQQDKQAGRLFLLAVIVGSILAAIGMVMAACLAVKPRLRRLEQCSNW
jgi:uncharacterized integral membrane protein